MSLGKKLTPYNADHRPALGAGNISCTATDGDPRWHNVSQKMLRLMVHFSWGWLGLDISWYMAYIYMAWDICWHMLTYVDICWHMLTHSIPEIAGSMDSDAEWIHHSLAESVPSSPNGNEAVGPAAADVSPWLQRCDLGAVATGSPWV